MKYLVRVIHPKYGELIVTPNIFDRDQYEQFLIFAEKYDLIVLVEEVYE